MCMWATVRCAVKGYPRTSAFSSRSEILVSTKSQEANPPRHYVVFCLLHAALWLWHERREGGPIGVASDRGWGVEFDQIQQILVSAFSSLFNLFRQHADDLTAAFVLLLGYRLMKVGILRDGAVGGAFVIPAYLARVAPGAALALAGVAFMFDRGPLSLLLCLLTVTVVVGFGFAVLGYRLFLWGVMNDSDPEALWNDRGLLLRRAAPGSLFAMCGLAMITFALWQGPSIVREYQGATLQANEQLTTAVDDRLAGLIDEVKAYVGTPTRQGAVEPASGSRPPAETRSPR